MEIRRTITKSSPSSSNRKIALRSTDIYIHIMRKVISFCYAVCLLASALLNVFFFTTVFWDGRKWGNQLTWSQNAAAEAEAVALESCSDHGRAYLDGSIVYGKPVCECNTCFQGPDCSELLPDCAARADIGDPLFLEPFWMQNAASSALLVAPWHRMSYSFADETTISQELVKHIHKLHAIAKNAVTDGRYILFGVGSTQILNAAVYALSQENSSMPAKVVAASPYFPLYKLQTDYLKTVNYEFLGDVSLVKNSSDSDRMNVIEFVTSPNNPDGFLRKAVLEGPSVNSINDHAYYWPHFTAIPAPADEDVMIFTISKLTGHAGSRFGWAIIKNKNVYDRMMTYINLADLGISRDSQLRALKLLKVIIEDDGKEIFNFGYKRMSERWSNLDKLMKMSKHFSLQEIPLQYCTYFNKVRGPSPAYAWLTCEREEDTNCAAVLKRANIIGRSGSMFFSEDRFVRLSLLNSQDDFEQLQYRLKQLVTKEEGGKAV